MAADNFKIGLGAFKEEGLACEIGVIEIADTDQHRGVRLGKCFLQSRLRRFFKAEITDPHRISGAFEGIGGELEAERRNRRAHPVWIHQHQRGVFSWPIPPPA